MKLSYSYISFEYFRKFYFGCSQNMVTCIFPDWIKTICYSKNFIFEYLIDFVFAFCVSNLFDFFLCFLDKSEINELVPSKSIKSFLFLSEKQEMNKMQNKIKEIRNALWLF
jgi:hypothetical protein